MKKNYRFKNILRLLKPTKTYSVMTTNTMEGIANANKHNSIRSRQPAESLCLTIHFIIRHYNALMKNILEKTRDGGPQFVTTVAQNIMERIVRKNPEMRGSKVVWHSEKILSDDEAKYFGLGGLSQFENTDCRNI